MNPVSLRDRYLGSFLGLAAGDALGTSVEFKPPGSFEPLTDMVGGGAFNLRHRRMDGRHLDGTVSGGEPDRVRKFDAGDQMACFVRWYREGYLSSTSECFDIGNTTAEALQRFEQTGAPFAGSTEPDSAGNGSIMRLAPVPLFFAGLPPEAVDRARDSSRTTHGAAEPVDACRYLAGLIVGVLTGKGERRGDRRSLLSDPGFVGEKPAVTEDLGYRSGFIQGTAARKFGVGVTWSRPCGPSIAVTRFRLARSKAVNLGDNADTTGAVYGQLAGAYYGVSGIPDE